MRGLWILGVLTLYALRRAGTRVDEAWTLRRRRTSLDAEVVEQLAAQFRERYVCIDDWLRNKRERLTPAGGASWRWRQAVMRGTRERAGVMTQARAPWASDDDEED